MHKIFIVFLILMAAGAMDAQTVGCFAVDVRGGYVMSSANNLVFADQLLDEDGQAIKPAVPHQIHSMMALNAQYRFAYTGVSRLGRLYPGAYQGVGLGLTTFFNHRALGTPVNVYVMQGAPVKHFSPRLSLGYEWNFGLSAFWHNASMRQYPSTNVFVGSRFNAYINLGFMLTYRLTDKLSLSGGVEMTHYSNGNTSLPNPGVNSAGVRLGVAYTPGGAPAAGGHLADEEKPKPHWECDLLIYGSAAKKAVDITDKVRVAAPGRFAVAGISVAPMRVINQYFRVGGAIDFKYDNGSNLQNHLVEGSTRTDISFTRRPVDERLMAGLSAHAELVMPIFSVNVGIGRNLLGVWSNRKFYQQAHLKIRAGSHVWVNIGYQLHSFQHPDNLMLGMGYTFR